MMRSGGWSDTALSAASPLPTTCASVSPAALERVLDEAGDVLFVFDDEYAVSRHSTPLQVPARRFPRPYRSC